MNLEKILKEYKENKRIISIIPRVQDPNLIRTDLTVQDIDEKKGVVELRRYYKKEENKYATIYMRVNDIVQVIDLNY